MLANRLLPDAQWKVLLCAIMFFLSGLNLLPLAHWERFLVPGIAGTMVAELAPEDHEHRQVILQMAPDSPLALAGAHVGDLVTYGRQSDSYRYVGTDELIPIRLTDHNGHSRDVLLRPVAKRLSPFALAARYFTRLASTVAALGIGFLVGFRRADSHPMRILALSLMSLGLIVATFSLPPGPLMELCYKILWPLTFLAGYLGIAYFTLQLPESKPHWRYPWVRKLFYVLAFAWLIQAVAILLYRNDLLPFAMQPLIREAGIVSALDNETVVLILIASWASWRQSTGSEKQRMAWIGASFGLLYFLFSYTVIFSALGIPLDAPWLPLVIWTLVMCAYLGLGYAILRHKLFDVGFAVNRVLVYSIMSTVLLLLFSLTEFGVDKLLHFEGREKNAIFDAAVALGIILTFHRIQHWINHRVDHVFFHHWQAAADKLRRFVEHAPYVSEPDALQAKFLHALDEFGGARGSAMYWADDSGKYLLAHATLGEAPASIDADHDVAVELRATRGVVDLSDSCSAWHADLVFPLLTHNQVAGVLLVGAKSSGHAWRPDEISLLAKSVPRICMALETLRLAKLERIVASQERKQMALERELAVARASVAELKLAMVGEA